ncbi:hypothetical protein EYF80_045439 [Liparis tanakae]|uniref:Uncharacterized protein n=1 Tax=Liparis tanakae TaxID=230148 RepID=A0A4Z2FU98_9TELE|nr:hypothetical protein EYF80_045439 [Liparis tanakae]
MRSASPRSVSRGGTHELRITLHQGREEEEEGGSSQRQSGEVVSGRRRDSDVEMWHEAALSSSPPCYPVAVRVPHP